MLPASGRTRDVRCPACQGLCRADIDCLRGGGGEEKRAGAVRELGPVCRKFARERTRTVLYRLSDGRNPVYAFLVDSVAICAN